MDRMLETLALIAGMVGASTFASADTGSRRDDSNWLAKTQIDLDRECKQLATQKVADAVEAVHPWFRVVNINPAVERFQIQKAVLPVSGSLEVFVDVIESAQQGSLCINLGGEALDLGGQSSSLVFRFEGSLGLRMLSFSSGVTMSNIALSIRGLGCPKGVTAFAGASGVTIQSTRMGDNAFVSVRVVNDGGIQEVAPEVGIYRMLPGNANQHDPATQVAMDSAQAAFGVRDHGPDIRGIVNGWGFSGPGTVVWITDALVQLRIDLAAGPLEPGMTANAQKRGLLRSRSCDGRDGQWARRAARPGHNGPLSGAASVPFWAGAARTVRARPGARPGRGVWPCRWRSAGSRARVGERSW